MKPVRKACPIVLRQRNGCPEVLAFAHPTAGRQFVKGTVQSAEHPLDAAIRELREESGIRLAPPLKFLGSAAIGAGRQQWHFFVHLSSGLPDTWSYRTEDGFGHDFALFWHPLDEPLEPGWHADFHTAFGFFAPRCLAE